ncbi:MAG: delta-60 repeat domain-containing protein, partial [Verrucomicrobiota bacterium]
GFFFTIGGQSRSQIARLNPNGSADSFNPTGSSPVHAVAVQADGKILAGGQFVSMGGETRNRIARMETDGRLDRTLNLSIVGDDVFATAVQPDGKMLIGGKFSSILGVARNNIARLNTDGTLDTAFNPNPTANSVVHSIAVQADGRILVGGESIIIGGQSRFGLARLDAMGLDDPFDSYVPGAIFSIVIQEDGKILVGGNFTVIGQGFGGHPRNRIARLDPISGLPDSFDPNASGLGEFITAIAVQADGKVLAGGLISIIGGQSRIGLARVDGTTGLVDSFNANANSYVVALLVQPDGRILAGGSFGGTNSIGGQSRNGLARLNAVTGLADSFDPNADIPNPNAAGSVSSIALQSDGKVLAGGDFNSIGGQALNHIARLEGTIGLADSFNANADGSLNSIAVQADGKILTSGRFMNIGGQARYIFARLSNNTAALQNLLVTPTTVTWTRGGSSPQFTRVTFEVSTDHVNYTPLGPGTPSGQHWTLTSLNLPTGQNLYVRARGFYRSGNVNGSESIQEAVRNAFLRPLARITSIARLAGGVVELRGLGTPNATYPIEAAPDLSPLSFMSIGNVTPDEMGDWLLLDLGASGQARRFYRLAFP